MISGIERVTARRIWFVPDFMVWGVPNIGAIECVATETDDATTNIMFGIVDIGDGPQPVRFNQLIDHRGNVLPPTIISPRVIPRPRTADAVFVVGAETPTGFSIAHDTSSSGAIPVDLLVMELGD